MHSALRTATLLAMCAAAAPAFAQGAGPQPSVTTAAFSNWLLVCHDAQGAKICEVDQNVADKQGRPVMRLRIGHIAKTSTTPLVVAQLPVNVAVGHPIIWQVGDVKVALQLRACLINSCFADTNLSNKTLRALEHVPQAAKTQFTMTRANGAKIALPLSFKGFTDAWRASKSK